MRSPVLPIIVLGCIAAIGLFSADRKGLFNDGINVHVVNKCMNVKGKRRTGEWRNVDHTRYASAQDLRRGDVIVVRPSDDRVSHTVTRVIGLPGDTVEVEGDHVWVNDAPLSHEPVQYNTTAYPTFLESGGDKRYKVTYSRQSPIAPMSAHLGRSEFFVMSDDRAPGACHNAHGSHDFSMVTGAY